MLVEHPDGTLFVAGYGEPRPTLWKSGDGGRRGRSWMSAPRRRGRIVNSDIDLAVGADGTLYFASMLFGRKASEGRQIAVGVSGDAGANWRWTTLSEARFDDRPWIEVAAHAIWNGGSEASHRVSRDRGVA